MLTKEEAKQKRLLFWLEFDNYSVLRKKRLRKSLKWKMNNTGIKQIKLKFDFNDNKAIAGIVIETRNLEKRTLIYSKLLQLKTILESAIGQHLIWEPEHNLPSHKSISRVYLEITNVSIYQNEDWPQIMAFFYKNMNILERFFDENKDFLKQNEPVEE